MVANRGFVVALGLLVCSQASAQPHHRKHKKLDRLAPAKEPEPQGQVELVALAPEIELDPAPPMPPLLQDEVVQVAAPAPTSSWQFELGPYVWASNVDVNIDLGILSAGTNIGFVQLVQHARYGIEGLGELRNGHVSFAGDVVYGAASVSASTPMLGGLGATITGNASTLITDELAGYEVLGGQDTWFSIDGRAGLRYERTAVNAELDTLGIMLTTKDIVESGCDALVGARVTLRPTHWLALTGAADTGVFGSSQSTWSVTADASVKLTSALRVTAGWRTLAIDRSSVDLTLAGPRVAALYRF